MSAKVLYLDIETSPILAHVWGLRDQFVGINQIIEDPTIIGVGYGWDGKPAKYASTWDIDAATMLEFTHDMLDRADVVVHYNGLGFDIPWINGELARAGYHPPSPFKNIDLYRVVRKNFRFPSYKLQYVSTALGLEGKVSTGGHQLWIDCINGDKKARAKMARYCKQDVNLLPDLLDKVRPWLGNGVNFALWSEHGAELACQKCGSDDLERRGYAYTPTSAYQQYRCRACGGWTRGTKRELGSTGTGIAL